ncbi:hypothetical protein HYX19_04200 [Candidatus Woesearchaeota archaeon]|nr:hypothetical protein [Candidatus Woesearchaeota archaeon]
MTREKLTRRVDLEKLTKEDFMLRGEFRIEDERYNGWGKRPEFKPRGKLLYVLFDQLFPESVFHECYELIVQTEKSQEVIASGYLHRSKQGDVSFGVLSGILGQNRSYHTSFPVWFKLLDPDKAYKPIISGTADLIFVKVSPWQSERDAQRQRVLYAEEEK